MLCCLVRNFSQTVGVSFSSVACEDSCLFRDGEVDRPLIVVIVELFDRRIVCAGVDSKISRSGCAESTVERGVEGRRVRGSCQAGEAGYSEE